MYFRQFASSFIITSFLGVPSFAGKHDDLYETAVISSSTIERIHQDGIERREREQGELEALQAFVVAQADAYEGDLSHDVLADLTSDLAFFQAFTEKVKSLSQTGDILFQFTSSKALYGATLALALHESAFDRIMSAQDVEGYSLIAPRINDMEDKEHIYATGRGRAIKHLLVRAAMRLLETDSIHQVFQKIGFSLHESPWVQLVPLPEVYPSFDLPPSPFVADGFLQELHNGYAFGGSRRIAETSYPAHDCSSFVASYSGCEYPVSTLHQNIHFQLHCGLQFDSPEIVQLWESKIAEHKQDPWVMAMNGCMEPVAVFDIDCIPAGSVYAHRGFRGISTNEKVAPYGRGGHTAFVLGFVGQGPECEVITLGANRDLGGRGFDFIYGVQPYPAVPGSVVEDELLRMYFLTNDIVVGPSSV